RFSSLTAATWIYCLSLIPPGLARPPSERSQPGAALMTRRVAFPTLSLTLVSVLLFQAAPRADDPPQPAKSATKDAEPVTFSKQVAPLLNKYCTKCHGGDKPKAGLALDKFSDEASVLKAAKTWEKVLHNLKAGEMPPPERPQPTPAERDLIMGWIDSTVLVIDCNGSRDPGRVTLRRLNRAEYNNTIRDL